MGGRSGKFVVPHTEEKTGDSTSKPETVEQIKALDTDQPVQLLNGVVTAGPDVPSIDELAESTECVKLENGHKEDKSDEEGNTEANGNVCNSDTPQETDNKPSKKGNPISRILRRISKKTISFKKNSCDKGSSEKPEDVQDETNKEENPVEPQSPAVAAENNDMEPVVDNSVSLAADKLVQDVILSATATHMEETQVCESKPCENGGDHFPEIKHAQELSSEVDTSYVTSNGEDSYIKEEPVVDCQMKSEDVVVNGIHSYNGEMEELNSNNTNVHNDDSLIQSKLANLELVNGHAEVNGFHCETTTTTDSVVVANNY
ncbi:unnamed protein product [Trichobilharzia szidati]|nr:unnamed protein product [Trichobilharzia szidati]